MRRRIGALVVSAAVVAGGCSGSARAASHSTSTLAGPDPYVVPAVITPAYVNAVFVVLNHIYGNATRALVAAKAVTTQVRDDLRAIYDDPLYAQEIQIAEQSLNQIDTNVIQPPGDIRTRVRTIVSSSASCVFVSTVSNFSAVLKKPQAVAAAEYWVLRLKHAGNDPADLNPTAWALSFNADYKTSVSIPDQCIGF